MNWIYSVGKSFVIMEYSLILAIIAITYFYKMILFLKNRNKTKTSLEIENHLAHLIASNQQVEANEFPQKWQKLEILLPIIQQFDNKTNSSEWNTIKNNLIKLILLPLARSSASNNNWVSRCYSAEVFTYLSESNDEQIILKLVSDELPLVYVNALDAAILNGSETCINTIITHMAKQTWFSQSMFYQAFDKMQPQARYFIAARIVRSQDISVKTICYNILLKHTPLSIDWDINSDLNSDNIWLKLAATQYISHADKNSALPFLIDGLEDPHWQIREASLNCLNHLQAKEAINDIALTLNDSNWAVGLAAVRALHNFGEEGRKILGSLNMELNPIVFQVAQHVTH